MDCGPNGTNSCFFYFRVWLVTIVLNVNLCDIVVPIIAVGRQAVDARAGFRHFDFSF